MTTAADRAAPAGSPQGGGAEWELRNRRSRAVISTHGAALRLLQVDGRDLVRPFPAGTVPPVFSGMVVAPWPNRVRDGRYTWHGVEHQLPVTEPERGAALHGFSTVARWSPVEHDRRTAVLGLACGPTPGYPSALHLAAIYRLLSDGLSVTVTATNVGDRAAPYGCTVHPYLVAGPGPVDAWTLQLPAAQRLTVDPDRLLPLDLVPVAGTPYDFRCPRPVAGTVVDHAYTGVPPDADGLARAVVRGPDGAGVVMSWDPATLPWVQICTADRPAPEPTRTGLAVEPMSCPPDALRSGTDLVTLHPGDTHRASWTLRRLDDQVR